MNTTRRFIALGGLAAAASLVGCAPSLLDIPQQPSDDEIRVGHEPLLKQSPSDKYATVGFDELALNPALNLQNLRKSVGFVTTINPRVGLFSLVANSVLNKTTETFNGSAFLLDEFGTLVLCNHEYYRSDFYISFTPKPSFAFSTRATIVPGSKDTKLDIVFAKLDHPWLIKKHDLRPVTFEKPIYPERQLALLGFINERLYASVGSAITEAKRVKTDVGILNCKVTVSNSVWHGVSGGPLFCGTSLVGMANAGSSQNENGFFTRSHVTTLESIIDAYTQLFPVESAATGVRMTQAIRATLDRHPECAFRPSL
jgi:hypothetical protein